MKQKKGVFMKSELLAEANKNYPNSEYHYNEKLGRTCSYNG